MIKKAAVLLDGSYVLKNFKELFKRYPSAQEVVDFATKCFISNEEELLRFYYYDCPPFSGKTKHPLSGAEINFSEKPPGGHPNSPTCGHLKIPHLS